METITEYIESGILEMYVLGNISREEAAEVEKMAAAHEQIRKELDQISATIEKYASANAVDPHPAMRPFIMAIIDYSERLSNGEQVSLPPMLNEHSKVEAYAKWLNRADMALPANFEEMHAKIIGYTPEVITAIVWIRSMAPEEVHHHEYEKFLIVEGSCDITIADTVHPLVAGDYLTIPLHSHHEVKITSDIPCKAILQRVAA